MSKIFNTDLNNIELLNYLCVFCFFIFPIFPFFSSVSLILFSLFTIPHLDRRNFTTSKISVFLLLNAIYIIYIITSFYSPNQERAFDLLIRLFPIPGITALIVFGGIAEKLNYEIIKKAYVGGVLVGASIALLTAVFRAIKLESLESLFYFSLTEVIHAHPVYFSLQVLTSIAILLNFASKEKSLPTLFLIAFFTITIFFLQSKSAFVLMLLLFAFKIFKKGFPLSMKIAVGLFFLVSVIVISKTMDSSNNRFSQLFENVYETEIGSFEEDGIQQRKWQWSMAWDQYKEKPLFGYGLGSQRNLFRWKIEKSLLETKGLSQSYIKAAKEISKLNLHNQYLQLLYESGIFGLLAFLISSTSLLFLRRKVLSNTFLMVFFIFFSLLFTENMLDRQIGIYFYSFILVFLYFETNSGKMQVQL